jgi:mRNA deadenylase 3'-5' endonuclease subunit Ccr4
MHARGKFLFSDYTVTIFPAFQYIFYMQVSLLLQMGANGIAGEDNGSKFNSLT